MVITGGGVNTLPGSNQCGTFGNVPVEGFVLSNLTQTYTGAAIDVSVSSTGEISGATTSTYLSCSPVTGKVTVTYYAGSNINATPITPINVGSYSAVCTGTIASGIVGLYYWTQTISVALQGTLTILPRSVRVTLTLIGSSIVPYTGLGQQVVSYTTDPPDIGVYLTYNGSSALPKDPGTYTAVANLSDSYNNTLDSQSSTSVTFTISPAKAFLGTNPVVTTYLNGVSGQSLYLGKKSL